jgi:hypothetical protein
MVEEKIRLEQFVDELNKTIPSHSELIKNIFNSEYGYPELDPVRDEICKCIICGLYQAAITVTNHLLEQSIKTCLIFKHSIENKKDGTDVFDICKDGIKKYDGINLSNAINCACAVGLITKEQKQLLHQLREDFRNAYSHASLSKIRREQSKR